MKYIVMDFGNVLAYPITGNWFITTKFMELVNIDIINYDKLINAMKKYGHILSRKAETLSEEYEIFYDFYKYSLDEIGYIICDKNLEELANYYTYSDTKYNLYLDTFNSLKKLSKKYTLLCLTDNWPCVDKILEKFNISKFFSKIYVSSKYGCEKKDGIFFNFPINDYNIKSDEALFIDDNEKLLDVASQHGFKCILMDRDKSVVSSKYDVVNEMNTVIKMLEV